MTIRHGWVQHYCISMGWNIKNILTDFLLIIKNISNSFINALKKNICGWHLQIKNLRNVMFCTNKLILILLPKKRSICTLIAYQLISKEH